MTAAVLSVDEEDVMRMLAAGMSDKAIANVLDVKRSAIDARIARVRAKLGAQTTVQAMHMWTMQSPVMERLLMQLARTKPSS